MTTWCEQQSNGNGWDGVVLCIAIFLILVILFRGVRASKECIIYLDDNPPQAPVAVSYIEKDQEPTTREATPPVIDAWNPSSAAAGTPYAA